MAERKTISDVFKFLETVVMPRFIHIDSRFDRIEAELKTCLKIDEAYTHFDRIYKKFEVYDQEFICIGESLRRLEGRMVKVEIKIDDLDKTLGKINN